MISEKKCFKKWRLIFFYIIIVTLLLIPCLSMAKEKIVVVTMGKIGVSDEVVQKLEQQVEIQLDQFCFFEVISGVEARRKLKHGFFKTLLDCNTDIACLDAAQTLQADSLFFITPMKLGENFSLESQYFKVSSAKVEKSFSKVIKNLDHHQLAVEIIEQIFYDLAYKERHGKITLQMNVEGAQVIIDKQNFTASKKQLIDVSAGKHRIYVKKNGFVPIEKEVAIEKCQEKPLVLEMTKLKLHPEKMGIGSVKEVEKGMSFPSSLPKAVKLAPKKKPWYKKWWVWTLAGVVVAGGAAGIVAMTGGDEIPSDPGGSSEGNKDFSVKFNVPNPPIQ